MTGRLRQIAPINARGIMPGSGADGPLPSFEWVDPRSLYIEEDYQRSLTEHSVALIRRIVAGWSWSRIKPVICVRDGKRLLVIDGQHTAIAAVSHGGVPKVPVMLVRADSVRERAEAFISQNRDRLALTAMHMHFAAAAAGEEVAIAVNEACSRAGVALVRQPRGARGVYRVGETMAVGIIARIVKRVGAAAGARALKVLVDAKRAPIAAQEIAAVGILMFEEPYRGKIDLFDLVTVLRSRSTIEWKAKAAEVAARDNVPIRNALALALSRSVRKEKRVA